MSTLRPGIIKQHKNSTQILNLGQPTGVWAYESHITVYITTYQSSLNLHTHLLHA